MKVACLVFNALQNDARVEKAVETYVAAGHEVRVVALAGAAQPATLHGAEVLRVSVERQGWRIPWPEDRLWRLRRLVVRLEAGWAALRSLGLVARWAWTRGRLPVGWRSREAWRLKALASFAMRVGKYRRFAAGALERLGAAGFVPDLVHANDFNTLFAAELLRERLGAPFIYDSHELWSGRNRGDTPVHPFEEAWELDAERRMAQKARGVITVSASIARHLSQVLGIREPAVVRNVPYDATERAKPRSLRASLGLPGDAQLLVYTGKATFNRGLEEAIEALALLPRQVHLLVLGSFEPRFRRLLEARIAASGVAERVHHYGPVPSEEVPSWAAEGDVCLVPIKGVCLSYEYCLPNKLFEGIQAGLPIIATDLVEMRRTLEEYRCGLTYRSGNVGELRDRIERILGSAELAAELRRNARRAARELNWEAERGRLIDVLSAAARSA